MHYLRVENIVDMLHEFSLHYCITPCSIDSQDSHLLVNKPHQAQRKNNNKKSKKKRKEEKREDNLFNLENSNQEKTWEQT